MTKYNYTYQINGISNTKTHNYISNSPMNACRKIANRFLRDKNDEIINFNITIVNMITNKKYYYKVFANKNEVPVYKQISKFKIIEMRYAVFIQKMPNTLIEYLKK